MVAFVPPPISSPDCDFYFFDALHERLAAETEEGSFEPEELSEEVDFFHEGELPGLEALEIAGFMLGVAGGCPTWGAAGVPEYVLL
jgi:hypothetical protein